MPAITKANWVEDSSGVVLAYITAADGTDLVASDVSSLTYSVLEKDPDTGAWSAVSGHSAVSLTPIATYIYDTLQTEDDDPRWYPTGGYNFAHAIAYTAFPTGGRLYRYECTIIESSGARYKVLAEGRAEAVHAS